MAEFNNSLGLGYLSEIPTLQNVTDAGNVTTNSMIIENYNTVYTTTLAANAINVDYDDGNQHAYSIINAAEISTNYTNPSSIFSFAKLSSDGYLELGIDNKVGTLNVEDLTNSITLKFPAKPAGSYTIATTEDITIPTLQSVSDAGDTTTTTVYLDGGAITNTSTGQASFAGESISTVNIYTGAGSSIDSGGTLSLSYDGIGAGTIGSQFVANQVELQIPNKPSGSYFIATTEDVMFYGLPAGGTAGQILSKIDSTNFNAQWVNEAPAASYTSTIKHKVKLGLAIAKGQAVYVSSADGTNMIVSKASNTSESTSSKTMGLLETGGATNAQVNVVTEGLLAGLNTSTAVIGDPVWLGTAGNLIYGLTNKPYAPAHLVFIGIVTRVSATVGEIFVKVQNGFELKEIHDVDLITTTPINGHLLGYNGTLWVNKTIATWLGYTPANVAGEYFTGNIDAPSMSLNGTDLESLMIAYAIALG